MHPDEPSQRVSHEAIYAAIYAQPKGGLKTLMIEALRQAKATRGRRRTTLAGSAIVPETLRIVHRPEDIEARLVPGHWEGDLIKGPSTAPPWARWSSARPDISFSAR